MFNFSSKSKTSVVKTVDPVEDTGTFRKIIILTLNLVLFLGLSFFLYKLVYTDGVDSKSDQILALLFAVSWICVLLISSLVLKFPAFLILVVFGLPAVFFPFLKDLDFSMENQGEKLVITIKGDKEKIKSVERKLNAMKELCGGDCECSCC